LQINSAVENAKLHDKQTKRAHAAYLGLVLLMILLWSTILISAVFTLRINKVKAISGKYILQYM